MPGRLVRKLDVCATGGFPQRRWPCIVVDGASLSGRGRGGDLRKEASRPKDRGALRLGVLIPFARERTPRQLLRYRNAKICNARILAGRCQVSCEEYIDGELWRPRRWTAERPYAGGRCLDAVRDALEGDRYGEGAGGCRGGRSESLGHLRQYGGDGPQVRLVLGGLVVALERPVAYPAPGELVPQCPHLRQVVPQVDPSGFLVA